MNELLKKVFSLGLGATIASKEKIQQVVDELVVKGELGQNESKDLIDNLVAKGEEQKDYVKQMVRDQVKKVLDELQIATKQDLKDLEARLKASGAGADPVSIKDPTTLAPSANSILIVDSTSSEESSVNPHKTHPNPTQSL
ncbi:phasin family protein [Paenibacillus agricola]|uniref:phasin family protein n=1 Tax=Paenibacillus agricola TaxID=2716264 RepID=UPI001A9CD022|nr:polyhydroxyalkanoate synthesis regulator [Paenibacillus agricola]